MGLPSVLVTVRSRPLMAVIAKREPIPLRVAHRVAQGAWPVAMVSVACSTVGMISVPSYDQHRRAARSSGGMAVEATALVDCSVPSGETVTSAVSRGCLFVTPLEM